MTNVTMSRQELVQKLADSVETLFYHDIPLKYLADYVAGCEQAFDLTHEEAKQLLYLIIRVK